MPRKSIDYSKTIIYHFVCNNPEINNTYVGSTTDFASRKRNHKNSCKGTGTGNNACKYKIMRENGGWENWTMVPLEEYPCENSIQSRIRERYWEDTLKADMNMVKAYQTEEEKKERQRGYEKQDLIKRHQDEDYRKAYNARKLREQLPRRDKKNAQRRERRKNPDVIKVGIEYNRWYRHMKKPYEDIFYCSCVFTLLK